ncbi:MAG: Abi family protein [Candidatus Symbiothrix sp.]|jgi:hypothetical protein|nr:Abi family protein [Candidatus Symbiothrix sp.]
MKYSDFEYIMSATRMNRYLLASHNNSKKAMTLYRKNLHLSQELFTIISCFEVAFRNAINNQYTSQYGSDWLRNTAFTGGIFDTPNCRHAKEVINKAIIKLAERYTHTKLLSEMDFGFWRYLFAQPQFHAGGQTLLRIFPSKPTSTQAIQYNHSFVFNQLEKINSLRNRIAHHEPVCFLPNQSVIDTTYARQHYNLILQLFQWMNIDELSLLYGLDHITTVCNEIDAFFTA